MDILQYAERISPISLNEYQKKMLLAYQKAKENNITIMVNYPARCGRKILLEIIYKFEKDREESFK